MIIFFTQDIIQVQANQSNIQFKNITIDDGLSQGTVEVLLQDSKGYVWIGTNDGLNRYDGYSFKTYKYSEESNSIANNYILSIKEDKYNNIWVATINGLSKIDSDGETIKNYYNKKDKGNLSHNNISDILITSDYKVLVSTANGLNLYDEKSDSFKRVLGRESDLTSQDIYSLEQDELGNIWIGTYNGLNKIDVKTKEIKYFYSSDKNGISENSIYKVYSDNKGNIWVGTFNSGVDKIDIKTNKITNYKYSEGNSKSLPGNYVRNMIRDNQGNMWICTDNGLAKYIEETETFITYKNDLGNRYSLLNNDVFSIIQDRTGLIWLGTYEGISIFNPQNNIEHYKNDKLDIGSLSSSVIHGIYEDEDGLVWIGTNLTGLNILNRDTGEVSYITKKDGLSNDSINYIVGDDKYIWVATNDGLNRIDKKTRSIKIYNKFDEFSLRKIKTLFSDSRGYLWIGTPNGLSILDKKTDEIIDITHYLLTDDISKDTYVESIHEDKEGNYWIGRVIDGGLTKLDVKNNSMRHYRQEIESKDSISSNSIKSIAEDKEGNLWIGTYYGLNKLDKKTNKITKYTEKDGLPNNTVYGITVDDDNNNIWITTNNGVSKFEQNKEIFYNYNIIDGFQGKEFNGGACYKNSKGEIFLGGTNGLNIFEPSQISKSEANKEKVAFEEFTVNNKLYKNINNMKFNYQGNSIGIKYFFPDFKNIEGIRYYYKIEEGEEWNETQNNEILYKNLKPGNYKFRIVAKSSGGLVSQENKVSFTIRPHILLSGWAFIIYILIIVLAIKLNRLKMKNLDRLVASRTNQLREEMEIKNELFNKVIKLEQSKNNYFINLSHELRTPLNVISTTEQLILERIKRDKDMDKERLEYHTKVMQKNTKRLLNLINNIIDTSKIEHGNYEINIKENDIVYIVEETVLGLKDYVESKNIELIIDPEVEEKIIECDFSEIERCIVNLISNARKFTPEGGKIEVIIKEIGKSVAISVKDSGIGIPIEHQQVIFDRFSQVIDKNSEQKGGSGLGLTITKHIVEMHKGKIFVDSKENEGTTFTILLPTKVNNTN
ncbi:MAG: ligand-binding sensor domain-containing protein [Romboutsia sp.]